MEGNKYNDREMINGLINNNQKILLYMYKKIKPKIDKHMIINGCNKNDLDDIFQIVLIETKLKLDEKGFYINNFIQYLKQASMFTWYNESSKSDDEESNLEKFFIQKDAVNSEDIKFKIKPSIKKVFECYEYLGSVCKEIFQLRSEGLSYSLIGDKIDMNVTNVRVKRKRCYEELLNLYKKKIKDETN